LDEVLVRVNGVQRCLWRAVDHEGEVLESCVTKHRDKEAALRFLKKLMKRHGRAEEVVTDGLRSCGAALKDLGAEDRQVTGRGGNNRAESSHQGIVRGNCCGRLEERSVGPFPVLHLGFAPGNSGLVLRLRRGRAIEADPASFL
jgi:IS1 family transposase